MAAHSEERLARMGSEQNWFGKANSTFYRICVVSQGNLKDWSGGKPHLYSETIPLGPERKLLGSEIVPVQS